MIAKDFKKKLITSIWGSYGLTLLNDSFIQDNWPIFIKYTV